MNVSEYIAKTDGGGLCTPIQGSGSLSIATPPQKMASSGAFGRRLWISQDLALRDKPSSNVAGLSLSGPKDLQATYSKVLSGGFVSKAGRDQNRETNAGM